MLSVLGRRPLAFFSESDFRQQFESSRSSRPKSLYSFQRLQGPQLLKPRRSVFVPFEAGSSTSRGVASGASGGRAPRSSGLPSSSNSLLWTAQESTCVRAPSGATSSAVSSSCNFAPPRMISRAHELARVYSTRLRTAVVDRQIAFDPQALIELSEHVVLRPATQTMLISDPALATSLDPTSPRTQSCASSRRLFPAHSFQSPPKSTRDTLPTITKKPPTRYREFRKFKPLSGRYLDGALKEFETKPGRVIWPTSTPSSKTVSARHKMY